jgi:hypothetical protein
MENTSGFDEDNSRVYLRYSVLPAGEPFESATRPADSECRAMYGDPWVAAKQDGQWHCFETLRPTKQKDYLEVELKETKAVCRMAGQYYVESNLSWVVGECEVSKPPPDTVRVCRDGGWYSLWGKDGDCRVVTTKWFKLEQEAMAKAMVLSDELCMKNLGRKCE